MDNEKIEVRTDEIIEYLKDKKYQDAKKLVLENNAVDIAEIIEEIIDEISIEKAVVMYRMLPKDISVEVFSYLPVEDQVNIINVITDKAGGPEGAAGSFQNSRR